MSPMPSCSIFMSTNLSTALNNFDPKVMAEFSEEQHDMLASFNTYLGTVNSLEEADISQWVISSIESLFRNMSLVGAATRGHIVTHNTVIAYAKQLSINPVYNPEHDTLILVFDLLRHDVYTRPALGPHWLSSKYIHELEINYLH